MTMLCAPRQQSLEEWTVIVRGEYDESPGLSLTRGEVQRWWSMDSTVCDAVLEHLTKTGFLRQTARRHLFVRDEGWR
jgi:hypothetical protein